MVQKLAPNPLPKSRATRLDALFGSITLGVAMQFVGGPIAGIIGVAAGAAVGATLPLLGAHQKIDR